jgi:hypothetical protein
VPADIDLWPALEADDPEALCGDSAEDDRRVALAGAVDEPSLRELGAERLREARVRRSDGDAQRVLGVDALAPACGHAADVVDRGRGFDARQRRELGAGALRQLAVIAEERLPGLDGEQVGSQAVDRVDERGLGGSRDAEHGDHRRDADGDPERRERRAQPPRPQSDRAHRQQVAGQQTTLGQRSAAHATNSVGSSPSRMIAPSRAARPRARGRA